MDDPAYAIDTEKLICKNRFANLTNRSSLMLCKYDYISILTIFSLKNKIRFVDVPWLAEW